MACGKLCHTQGEPEGVEHTVESDLHLQLVADKPAEAVDRRHIDLTIDFAYQVVASGDQAVLFVIQLLMYHPRQVGAKDHAVDPLLPVRHPYRAVLILHEQAADHIASLHSVFDPVVPRGCRFEYEKPVIVAAQQTVGALEGGESPRPFNAMHRDGVETIHYVHPVVVAHEHRVSRKALAIPHLPVDSAYFRQIPPCAVTV